MVKGKIVETKPMKINQFLVIGRHVPTKENPAPKIWKMRVFARDRVQAKTKFWYFLRRQHKVKKASGEVISIHEVSYIDSEINEKNQSSIKNYGIVLRYQSRTALHNMYKEYRDISLNGAISQLYMEMSGRHRAQHDAIHIIKTSIVSSTKLLRRKHAITFSNPGIKFPKAFRNARAPTLQHRSNFAASRPNLVGI